MSDPIATVKRELLVRHLEAWAPAALHRGRRVIYAHGYADDDGGAAAEAALRTASVHKSLFNTRTGRGMRRISLRESELGRGRFLPANHPVPPWKMVAREGLEPSTLRL